MELRHLRYFLAVAERCHFRRAAEALHVSQPTLSQQIQDLEAELGSPLFERRGRGVHLTRAGETFRDYSRRALNLIEEGQAAIDEFDTLLRGRLVVGVVQTVNATLAPAVVARFAREHPGVELEVRELPAGEVEAGLVAGALDLGVSFEPGPGRELRWESLLDEELVLVLPEGHALEKRRRVRVQDLSGVPLALLGAEFCTRRLIDASFREVGLAPRVAVEMNSIEGLVEVVRAGGPATIIPELGARQAGLRAVKLQKPTPRRRVGLLRARGATPLRAREVFAGYFREALA